jgi:hypothetical protein
MYKEFSMLGTKPIGEVPRNSHNVKLLPPLTLKGKIEDLFSSKYGNVGRGIKENDGGGELNYDILLKLCKCHVIHPV